MQTGWPNTFKIVHLNAENLFLYLDDLTPRAWNTMTEKSWQALSHATVPNKSLAKTLWLAESLLFLKPDLITLNEVGGLESLTNFAQLFLQGLYEPFMIEGNSDRGIDVGFLLRRTLPVKAEIRTHKDRPLDLSYPHDHNKAYYFARDCAELRIYAADSSTPALACLLVHLKSKLDPEKIDPGGQIRRRAEANLLTQIYTEVRQELGSSVPVIVSGDFNGNVRPPEPEAEFAQLLTTDLKSVTELANIELPQRATQIQFNRGQGVQPVQIDYIFISPELEPYLLIERVCVFRYLSDLKVPMPLPKTLEQRTYLPSDHFPVVAEFTNFIS